MQSPEGERSTTIGCYLEIVDNERLVWTDALLPGYRPASRTGTACGPFVFTATILLEAQNGGTRYTAIAAHCDEASRTQHEEMGFHEGWGAALDQLVTLAKTL